MSTPEKTLRGLQLFQQARQLRDTGRTADAASTYARAYALLPAHPDLVADYATFAEQVQDWAAAEKLYRRLQALRPQAAVEGRLGLCLFRLDQYEAAVPLLQAHIARQPDDELRLALGLALFKLRRWEDALAVGRQLMATAPGEAALDIVLNCLFSLGRREELDALVEPALQRHGDSLLIVAVCAMHLLKSGDCARGFAWPHAVRMRYRPGMGIDEAPPRWWDGKPFNGILLVSGKQGLGDEILAASMFRDLQAFHHAHGQRVLVECDPRLLPLFRRSFPALGFVGRADDGTLPTAVAEEDYRLIKSMDLAHYFRRTTPLPPQQPWLLADTARADALRARYRQQHPGRRLAGLSWKSSRELIGAGKSMALGDCAPLLRLADYSWFSLQYGDVAKEIAALCADGSVALTSDAEIDATLDIDGLAAQIVALGMVVSTSNTTAHIAGALGVECHLLLPRERPVLWYWGYAGAQTPWYPSITIHRNSRDDDWQHLVAALANRLEHAP